MKERYYSNMSDENVQPPPAKDKQPALPPRTPLSVPDEAEEHPALERPRPENVKRTSYFPLQPPAQGQDAGQETPNAAKGQPGAVHVDNTAPPQQQPSHPPAAPYQDMSKEGTQGQYPHSINTDHPQPPQRHHTAVLEDAQGSQPHAKWQRSATTLTAFVIPFPTPQLPPVGAHTTSQMIPPRFMIYTPPSPPFMTKPEGESKVEAWRKEGISHFCRRKWYEELREAKMRQPKDNKTTKWKRVKWHATKGTDWGIDKTKSTNLEFLNRVARMQDESDEKAEDIYRKILSPEEILLLHAPDLHLSTDKNLSHDQDLLREAFTESLLRTKKRAVRNTLISAVLFAPAIVLDTIAVPVWPFGGLAEIDAVWLYASFRGAKTSRAITKRLSPTTTSKADHLSLTLTPFPHMDVLSRYLAARCHDADPKLFPNYVATPADTDVLKAIGWEHSLAEGRDLSWEDRQWELLVVKDDLERCFNKAAKEWRGWCKQWVKNPEKAVKK